jgi:hypothetical protein
MEGIHIVGEVTIVSKISICMCLISIKMHVCDACSIVMYFVVIMNYC